MIDASIIVVTYNHGPYIKQCFLSILAQETSRKLEIIWYDDYSTDDTIENGEQVLIDCNHEIVRLHAMNNRKQRNIPFRLDIMERCRGQFVFLTDGDDFWIDPKKIDNQINALNENPKINICFTPAFTFNESEEKPIGILAAHSDKTGIFSLEKAIEGDGGFMPTNSLCIRRSVYDSAPDWFYGYMPVGDYPIQVIASNPNGALFLPTITCGYRMNVKGSWMDSVFNVKKNRLEFELSFLELLIKLRNHIPGKENSFQKIMNDHTASFFKLCIETNDYSKLSSMHSILHQLPGKLTVQVS
jgi:glycosyltransferase involved in cell wall biosynthesis